MSVLRRNMFNRGGYAHRGTGIASGFLPVRMHEGGELPPDHKHTYMPDKSDAEVMNLLQAGSLTTTTPGNTYQGTEVPTLEELYEEKLPTAKKLFGEPAKPTPGGELVFPWLMNLSASLMSGKSLQGGFGGALEIIGNAMRESTPALTEAMALRKAGERANRAEEIEAAKIAYQSAETERASLLDQASSLESTKLKLDAPEIGDTLFLVPENKAHLPTNVIMAYQKEETIDGKRIKNLYNFDGTLLDGKFTTYTGKAKPKDFSGVNVRFTIPGETEDEVAVSMYGKGYNELDDMQKQSVIDKIEEYEPIETERMAIGKFEQDLDGDWGVKYYYKDDENVEHELPGNAVIIAREGDASEVGQTMDKKEEKALMEQEIAGTKFILKAIEAWSVISAQPGAATDVGNLAGVMDRIVADAKALVAVMGGTYEVDHAAMENYMEEDLGIATAKLRSVYLDLAISRAVFVEGGTRVTDRDVINQLNIIGAKGKSPEAALVLLQDFVDFVARDYWVEHKIRAEKNKLIEPVDEFYLLRNLKLPWRTTGTIAEGNENNTTIGPSDDDDEVRKKILEILEEREKD